MKMEMMMRLLSNRQWRLDRQVALFSLFLAACGGGSGKDKPGPGGGVDKRPVSVVATKVVTRDMPVTLDGLGTVTAF